MSKTGIGDSLIEKYAKRLEEWLFRDDDGQYLMLVDTPLGQFPVYLRSQGTGPDVVKVSARSQARYPVTERTRLVEWVNRFNQGNQWMTATVQDAPDSPHVQVVATNLLCVTGHKDFGAFRAFVDMSLVSAYKLFKAADAEMALPTPTELEEWFRISS
jgi:hypothetical protein